MQISELAKSLTLLGCPCERSLEMAAQKDRSYEEALAHLLALMKQGWAVPKNL